MRFGIPARPSSISRSTGILRVGDAVVYVDEENPAGRAPRSSARRKLKHHAPRLIPRNRVWGSGLVVRTDRQGDKTTNRSESIHQQTDDAINPP
jgi:hypothetical protein